MHAGPLFNLPTLTGYCILSDDLSRRWLVDPYSKRRIVYAGSLES